MPCTDSLTPRQCRLRDHLAKKLEGKEDVKNPWAVATAIVEKKVEARRANQ
jgi:hypothetical protein